MAATNTVTDLVGSRLGGLIDHRGRLYLTEEHLCFSSNIIGVKTKFVSYPLFLLKANSAILSTSLTFFFFTEAQVHRYQVSCQEQDFWHLRLGHHDQGRLQESRLA